MLTMTTQSTSTNEKYDHLVQLLYCAGIIPEEGPSGLTVKSAHEFDWSPDVLDCLLCAPYVLSCVVAEYLTPEMGVDTVESHLKIAELHLNRFEKDLEFFMGFGKHYLP